MVMDNTTECPFGEEVSKKTWVISKILQLIHDVNASPLTMRHIGGWVTARRPINVSGEMLIFCVLAHWLSRSVQSRVCWICQSFSLSHVWNTSTLYPLLHFVTIINLSFCNIYFYRNRNKIRNDQHLVPDTKDKNTWMTGEISENNFRLKPL